MSTSPLASLFQFQDPESAEVVGLTEEISAVIFESALFHFLSQAPAETADAFETYVTEHAEDEHFLDTLCAAYPGFERQLTISLKEFTEDAASLAHP